MMSRIVMKENELLVKVEQKWWYKLSDFVKNKCFKKHCSEKQKMSYKKNYVWL